MEHAAGAELSTRTICERAGVQAPTLYHHFDNKDGLLDAVVSHGFRRFLGELPAVEDLDDPIASLRCGWDTHVRFGVENPHFYAYVYGRVEVGKRCSVIRQWELALDAALQPAARKGLLSVPPADAAAQIFSACSGVTLRLISERADTVDWPLSAAVRDAIFARIVKRHKAPRSNGSGEDIVAAAVHLSALVDSSTPGALTLGESALLKEWLQRIAAS